MSAWSPDGGERAGLFVGRRSLGWYSSLEAESVRVLRLRIVSRVPDSLDLVVPGQAASSGKGWRRS